MNTTYKRILVISSFVLNLSFGFIITNVYTSEVHPVRIHPNYFEEYSIPTSVVAELNAAAQKWGKGNPKNDGFTVTNVELRGNTYIFSIAGGLTDETEGIHNDSNHEYDHKHSNFEGMELFNIYVAEDPKGGWQGASDTNIPELSKVLGNVSQANLSKRSRNELYPSLDESRLLSSLSPKAHANQSYNDYRFPYPDGTAFQITQGWHSGTAIDMDVFAPNADVLAMASGTVQHICQVPGQIQTAIKIRTKGTTEDINYVHVDRNTINFNEIYIGAPIEQSQKLGRMVEGNVSETCGISRGAHMHIIFPSQNFTVDGVDFTPSNDRNGEVFISSNEYCAPPSASPGSNREWHILSSCTMNSSQTAPDSVRISENSNLIIDNNAILDIDLQPHILYIESGSQIFVKDGSRVE